MSLGIMPLLYPIFHSPMLLSLLLPSPFYIVAAEYPGNMLEVWSSPAHSHALLLQRLSLLVCPQRCPYLLLNPGGPLLATNEATIRNRNAFFQTKFLRYHICVIPHCVLSLPFCSSMLLITVSVKHRESLDHSLLHLQNVVQLLLLLHWGVEVSMQTIARPNLHHSRCSNQEEVLGILNLLTSKVFVPDLHRGPFSGQNIPTPVFRSCIVPGNP